MSNRDSMPELTHRVTPGDAYELRRIARAHSRGEVIAPTRLDETGRYWLPIEHVEATGRARCRLCGELIGKGEECVRFELALSSRGAAPTTTAYLHSVCRSQ
jgi:hypothetical protein